MQCLSSRLRNDLKFKILLVIVFYQYSLFFYIRLNRFGFQDLVYQSKVCTSGSLEGVLAGSHYHRYWYIHSTVSEALERLFLKRFITECRPNVPSCLQNLSAEPKAELINKSLIGDLSFFLKEYKSFRERFRKGELGETP